MKHFPSAEIRDFLVFLLLELAGGGFSPARLGAEVVERSNGDLQPAAEDVLGAQQLCWDSGWIELEQPGAGDRVVLSPAGRDELRRRREAAEAAAAQESRGDAADRLVSLLPPPDGREVLDVGTGDGFLAWRLAGAGFRVLGVDADRDAVERAQSRAAGDARLRFRAADLHTLPTEGRRWPIVVSSYLLHECDDPVAALSAMRACLEPGGILACIDFAPNCAAYIARAGRTAFHPFRALAEGDWRALAPRLGLTDLRCWQFGYTGLTLARGSPRANSNQQEDDHADLRVPLPPM